MILKAETLIKKGEPGYDDRAITLNSTKVIYADVKLVEDFYDKEGCWYYKIWFKDDSKVIKITKKVDGGYIALVNGLWLMNDKGETIERLV